MFFQAIDTDRGSRTTEEEALRLASTQPRVPCTVAVEQRETDSDWWNDVRQYVVTRSTRRLQYVEYFLRHRECDVAVSVCGVGGLSIQNGII
jgi:hypothetical protein